MLLVAALTNCSDDELMVRLQRAEIAALEALYERHHRLALALAFRIVNDRDAAEEVVQESFVAVWRQASTFRPDRGGARGWILSVVRHRAIDRIRRARNLEPLADLGDAVVDRSAPDPWQVADANARRERIKEALDSLPPEQREVVELAYFGGLTHQEIAERTGAPLGTIKGRTRLAMEKLRVSLSDLAPDATAPAS